MTLEELRAEAARCRACPLWQTGTQTVFGEGAAHAAVMLVGEQPGDQEDRQGPPFVTNAVKRFKWEARGKRRIHQKPTWTEMTACRPVARAGARGRAAGVLVGLGATAGQSLLGKQFRVTKERGRWLESELAEYVIATIHPSAILRQRDDESRHREMAAFVEDLRLVAGVL